MNDIDIKKNSLINPQLNLSKNIEFIYDKALNKGKKDSLYDLYNEHLFIETGMFEWMKIIVTKPDYDKVQEQNFDILPTINTTCRFLQEDLTILFANIIGGRNYGTF